MAFAIEWRAVRRDSALAGQAPAESGREGSRNSERLVSARPDGDFNRLDVGVPVNLDRVQKWPVVGKRLKRLVLMTVAGEEHCLQSSREITLVCRAKGGDTLSWVKGVAGTQQVLRRDTGGEVQTTEL